MSVDSEKDKGNAAFREEDYAIALKHYDKAIKHAGSGASAALFSNKAAALLKLRRYDECLQQCLKGLTAPELTAELKSKIYFRMGSAYESQGKLENSLEAFSKCDASPQVLEKTASLSCQLAKEEQSPMKSLPSFMQAASCGGDSKGFASFMERLAKETPGDGGKQSRFELEFEHSLYVAKRKERQCGQAQMVNRRTECPDSGHICIAPLCDLKPITIGQMRLHEINVGKVLICRTIAEPFMINAVGTLIEDPNGEATAFYVYNLCSSHADLNTVLPVGTYLAVKEPWYKTGAADGKRMLRVDNPADIVYLEQTHFLLKNLTWQTNEPGPTSSSGFKGPDSWASLEKRGHEHFVAGRYPLARTAYSDAIEMKRRVAPMELADLFANRAAAYLGDEQAPEAIIDCQSALKLKPDHLKATFRYAKALSSLSKYDEAKEVLAKSPHTTTPAFKAEISRLTRLMREQQSGDYDLKSLLKEAAASVAPRLDHADYSAGVQVLWISNEKGNGLFAQRDFAPGELIFVEKAFEAAYTSECGVGFCFKAGEATYNSPSHNECLSLIIRRISKNPNCAKELGRLYAGPEFERFQEDAARHEKSRDRFAIDSKRAEAIVSYNAFGRNDFKWELNAEGDRPEVQTCGSYGFAFGGCGVWIQASFMNHSCVPNTMIFYVGDLMVVRAAKRVRKGEELFTAYVPTSSNYKKRQASLKKFGFKCCCKLCVCDEKRAQDQPDLDDQREAFVKVFNRMVPRLHEAVQDHLMLWSSSLAKLVEDVRKSAEEFSKRLAYKDRYDPHLSRLYSALGYAYNAQRKWLLAAKAYELAYFAVVGNGTKPGFISHTFSNEHFFDCYNIAGDYLHGSDLAKAKEYVGKMLRAARISWGSADQEMLMMIYPELPLQNLFDI